MKWQYKFDRNDLEFTVVMLGLSAIAGLAGLSVDIINKRYFSHPAAKLYRIVYDKGRQITLTDGTKFSVEGSKLIAKIPLSAYSPYNVPDTSYFIEDYNANGLQEKEEEPTALSEIYNKAAKQALKELAK